LSSFYSNLANFSSFHNVIGKEAAKRKSREAAEKILAINPEYAPIYAILASLESGDVVKRAQILQKGLQLEPYDRSLLNGSASMFSAVGRASDAIPIYRYLVKRSPTEIAVWYNLALAYFATGDFHSAEAAIERALILSPGNAVYQWARAMLYCVSREYQPCLDSLTELAERSGDEVFRLQGEAFALPALGRNKEGAEALKRLQSDDGDGSGFAGFAIAFVLAMQGRHEEVLDELENWRPNALIYIKENPEFAPLHASPRWHTLMEKLAFSDQKLAELNFEIELPE
jgi:predicted Zn-dependent protease